MTGMRLVNTDVFQDVFTSFFKHMMDFGRPVEPYFSFVGRVEFGLYIETEAGERARIIVGWFRAVMDTPNLSSAPAGGGFQLVLPDGLEGENARAIFHQDYKLTFQLTEGLDEEFRPVEVGAYLEEREKYRSRIAPQSPL